MSSTESIADKDLKLLIGSSLGAVSSASPVLYKLTDGLCDSKDEVGKIIGNLPNLSVTQKKAFNEIIKDSSKIVQDEKIASVIKEDLPSYIESNKDEIVNLVKNSPAIKGVINNLGRGKEKESSLKIGDFAIKENIESLSKIIKNDKVKEVLDKDLPKYIRNNEVRLSTAISRIPLVKKKFSQEMINIYQDKAVIKDSIAIAATATSALYNIADEALSHPEELSKLLTETNKANSDKFINALFKDNTSKERIDSSLQKIFKDNKQDFIAIIGNYKDPNSSVNPEDVVNFLSKKTSSITKLAHEHAQHNRLGVTKEILKLIFDKDTMKIIGGLSIDFISKKMRKMSAFVKEKVNKKNDLQEKAEAIGNQIEKKTVSGNDKESSRVSMSKEKKPISSFPKSL